MSTYHVHNSTLGGIVVRTSEEVYECFNDIDEAERFAKSLNEAYNLGCEDTKRKINESFVPVYRQLGQIWERIFRSEMEK